jgi:hypothetical protein
MSFLINYTLGTIKNVVYLTNSFRSKNFPIDRIKNECYKLTLDIFNQNNLEEEFRLAYKKLYKVEKKKSGDILNSIDNKHGFIFLSACLVIDMMKMGYICLTKSQYDSFNNTINQFDNLLDYYVERHKSVMDSCINICENSFLEENDFIRYWNVLNVATELKLQTENKKTDFVSYMNVIDKKITQIKEYWRLKELDDVQ